MKRSSALLVIVLLLAAAPSAAGPETALREFASGEIKKGVRSIGLGGDGATWGNYSLVYRDESSSPSRRPPPTCRSGP